MISDYELLSNASCSEKRDTLGQQWIDVQTKYAGQKTQEVRETTTEMGKEYMKSLWKVVKDHQYLSDIYYIMEVMRPSPFLEGVIELKHIARRTRPKPEWGLAIYKVDNKNGVCEYVWGLPKQEEAALMMSNPEGWDQKTIRDISDYISGKLV